MTTNVVRTKTMKRLQPDAPIGPAIGETDARVFTCPGCARPLSDGTWRCPGCGVRLVMGVRLQRAAGILVLGAVLGAFGGGAVTAVAISPQFHASSPAAVVTPSIGPTASSASIAPSQSAVAPGASVPQAAISALNGTAVVNGRIALDAATLSAALAAKDGSTIDIARAIRSLAADAALGIDVSARLASWRDAAATQSELETFYRTMSDTARVALQASFSDTSGYRVEAAQMLQVLRGLGAVDATSRTLASSIDLELPPVALD